MAPGQKVTDRQIEIALMANGGLITHAAKDLGVTYGCLRKRMKSNEHLREVVADAIEGNLDIAESALMKKIKEGHVISMIFYLKCKGKARGYIERQEITGADGAPLNIEIIPATGEEDPKSLAGRKPRLLGP
ncbi:MAG: hypothetical protein KAR06_11065 [Deltaproteobacteria bacterium]|nr:hypothetical protein [Deltaproteobacteria bacterium]